MRKEFSCQKVPREPSTTSTFGAATHSSVDHTCSSGWPALYATLNSTSSVAASLIAKDSA